jgi:hypothetical protein
MIGGKRFVAIVAYFGRLESYADIWRATAGMNPEIDFLFVGDVEIPESQRPANVHVARMTVRELEHRVTVALGFEYRLARAYKLTDLQPTFGLVFHDLLRGYDYWGHCDTDLVFGRLVDFFPPDWERYDKLFPYGNLAFYRNDDRVNTAFTLPWSGPDWQRILLAERSFHFDEERGITRILAEHGFAQYTTPVNADIDFLHGRMRLYFEQDPPPQGFFWRDGRTYRAFATPAGLQVQEYAYIHFQQRPMTRRDFRQAAPATGFWVVPDGFMKMSALSPRLADLDLVNWDIPLWRWRRRGRILRRRAQREARRLGLLLQRLRGRRPQDHRSARR